MKKLAIKSLLALPLLLILGLPFIGFAQATNPLTPGQQTNQPFTIERILRILNRLTDWLLGILVAVAIIFIIMAAFNYLTAGGDSEKVGKAHNMVIYAVVALAVGGVAKGVAYLVLQLIQ